tara:strand:- start:145 stop:540 length:396 start_codon:yes stop_codon:yes gene_type:complete
LLKQSNNVQNKIYINSLLVITFLSVLIILPNDLYCSNPLAKDINSINLGEELYKERCSNCHGIDAKGKSNGFFLSPDLKKFKKGYESFLYILTNGYGRMPAWGGKSKLSKKQLNELAAYLKKISSNQANWD